MQKNKFDLIIVVKTSTKAFITTKDIFNQIRDIQNAFWYEHSMNQKTIEIKNLAKILERLWIDWGSGISS